MFAMRQTHPASSQRSIVGRLNLNRFPQSGRIEVRGRLRADSWQSLVITALTVLLVPNIGTAQTNAFVSHNLFKLARVFASHAVFQRNQPFPVFGRDVPGTAITVSFAGQTLNTTVGTDGNWRVNLAPLALNVSPQTLAVTGSSNVTCTNILVGDVWLVSGQSNADWPLKSAAGGGEAVASATNGLIRYLQLAESPLTTPPAWNSNQVARLNPRDYFSGAWQVNNPTSAGAVSAIGYFFAHHIQTNQNVPVGLIDCAVGGTPAIAWMPDAAINANPALKTMAENYLESERVSAFVKKRILQNLADWDKAGRPAPMPEHPYKPGACWRLGLAEIAPFAMRGVIWYQGETDADFYEPREFEQMARWHTETFTALVAGWRAAWENKTLPVYFVQLPVMNRPSWPWFRESQSQCARDIPHTGVAVAWEFGNPTDVHPTDKLPVADRLALVARAKAYGEQLEFSGPIYRSHQIQGTNVVVEFDHATGSLVARDGQPLRWFELAGTNGQFFTATATISNSNVILSAPKVSAPVAVRYAWTPVGSVNFYNGMGLLAPPFRAFTGEALR